MKLQTRSINNIQILALAGRFDAYEEPPVRQWLNKTSTDSPAHVVVDLANVHFIDSTALSTLVQGMKHCRERNGDLHLCNLQQPVQIIFELTRLDKAFDIFPSEAEAIAAFKN